MRFGKKGVQSTADDQLSRQLVIDIAGGRLARSGFLLGAENGKMVIVNSFEQESKIFNSTSYGRFLAKGLTI